MVERVAVVGVVFVALHDALAGGGRGGAACVDFPQARPRHRVSSTQVAVSGGDVVGVASAAAVPADAWYVSAVATAPNWRRRGVISCAEIKVRGASRLTG